MIKNTANPLLLVMVLAALPGLAGAAEHHGKHAPAAKPYLYKTPKLNRAQFDVLLAKPKELLIIDVRRPDELTRVGGFPVYLSVQAKQLDAALPFIPKERSIVTVSNHAGRAGAAGDFLADRGFKVVGAVGSQNYEEEGGKITKIAPVRKKAK
jgi:rhodanese-related sulfurtransferase